MSRFFSNILLLSAVVFLPCFSLGADIPSAAKKPDVVIFIADDLSVKDCSPYANTQIAAPNMLALAHEGMTFDRAYATSPTCAPSRASILTGCYNLRNGSMFNQQRPKPE